MKLPPPERIANPVLAVLIERSGYPSIEAFGTAVADLGSIRHNLVLGYDHTTVKRWLTGSTCQHPDLVAAVLSAAWEVPIPPDVIWPHLRDGAPAASPQQIPCVADRTLEELASTIGRDMLTRRQMFAGATKAALGGALTEPLLRWLAAPTVGLRSNDHTSTPRLTLPMVESIETATTRFGADDASHGGGLSREAAVGQLKYAVDLLRDASYTEAVGNRALAAVAELAGMAGWMSHDLQMEGPAQRYFVLGLHAARESTDPRAIVLRASLLADLARQALTLGDAATGLRLVDAGLDVLPRGRYQAAEAMLWNLKARMLAATGPGALAEMRSALGLAEDLLGEADLTAENALIAYTSTAELAGNAALAWQDAAVHSRELAEQAEQQALAALAARPDGFDRSTVFDTISLANARFTGIDPDQAAADGHTALDLATEIAASQRVQARLGALMVHSQPYASRPCVRDFRERLRLQLAA